MSRLTINCVFRLDEEVEEVEEGEEDDGELLQLQEKGLGRLSYTTFGNMRPLRKSKANGPEHA